MRSRGERVVDLIAGVFTALVLLVLYSPVFINALFSVVQSRDGQIVWDSFSLAPYGSVWSDEDVTTALRNTGTVALVAVGTATLLAIAFALYTDREEAIGRQPIELAIYLPFLLPPIVTGLSLLVGCAELASREELPRSSLGTPSLCSRSLTDSSALGCNRYRAHSWKPRPTLGRTVSRRSDTSCCRNSCPPS